MDPQLLVVLPAFGTSILSGIFGMAGGLILMGIYTACLPVTEAMVLHGWTQAVANGLRAGLWYRNIHGRVLIGYLTGTLLAWTLLRWISWIPSPAFVFLGLGLMPFLGRFLSGRVRFPDIAESVPTAMAAGLLVNGMQGLAGVAGPLLDLFFVETKMGRKDVVATKAVTQVASHLMKLSFYLTVSENLPDRIMWLGAAIAAVLGTLLGSKILERITDTRFRQASRWLVLGIGSYYLLKGTMIQFSPA